MKPCVNRHPTHAADYQVGKLSPSSTHNLPNWVTKVCSVHTVTHTNTCRQPQRAACLPTASESHSYYSCQQQPYHTNPPKCAGCATCRRARQADTAYALSAWRYAAKPCYTPQPHWNVEKEKPMEHECCNLDTTMYCGRCDMRGVPQQPGQHVSRMPPCCHGSHF